MEEQEVKNLNETLDKMIVLSKSKKSRNIPKIIFLIFASIAGLMFIALICITIYKNSFSVESLISFALAFFSIAMSVLFFFKTDETSKQFYQSSYNFMKDVSVTLGKIEERFGEKLNNLNDKVSHLTNEREKTNEKIENAEDEKQKMIDELMNKAKYNEKEKEEFLKRLQEKDSELERLKQDINRIDNQYRKLKANSIEIGSIDEDTPLVMNQFSPADLRMLLEGEYENLSPRLRHFAKKINLVDSEGNLTLSGRRKIIKYL